MTSAGDPADPAPRPGQEDADASNRSSPGGAKPGGDLPAGSGFSVDWLDLRAPADARARSRRLEAALSECLPATGIQRIVDLGAGSGANLRALAPRLGPRQHWVLLDHDPGLAAAARDRLAGFAAGGAPGPDLHLRFGTSLVRVSFVTCDLAQDPGAPGRFGPDLVTASAFFDLASADWCAAFAAALGPGRPVVHAALTCTGAEAWMPPHPADAAVAAAYAAHQRRDKGMGPATGPAAPAILRRALEAAGYGVALAASPWHLADPEDRDLMAALAHGTAEAVAETGTVAAEALASWRTARTRPDPQNRCSIGHVDILALPQAGKVSPGPGASAPEPEPAARGR